MTSAFFALALALLMLAIGLYPGLTHSLLSWAGPILLGIASLGLMVVSLFPGDVYPAGPTNTGTIHTLGSALAFLACVAATLSLSIHFRKDAQWQSFQTPALLLSLMNTAILVIFIFDHRAIIQKIFVAFIVLWLFLTTIHFRSIVTNPHRD